MGWCPWLCVICRWDVVTDCPCHHCIQKLLSPLELLGTMQPLLAALELPELWVVRDGVGVLGGSLCGGWLLAYPMIPSKADLTWEHRLVSTRPGPPASWGRGTALTMAFGPLCGPGQVAEHPPLLGVVAEAVVSALLRSFFSVQSFKRPVWMA